MTRHESTTLALERCLAGAQRLATTSGADPDVVLFTAQARLLALRACPVQAPHRLHGMRLLAVNALAGVAWRFWDAAERLR